MTQENAESAEDLQLRAGFNQQASLYQKIRPHYPDALFDTLVDRAHLSTGADVLEIGPGTGRATRPLAARGYHITAVELGADLAAVARDNLKGFPNVKVITGAFEDVELPAGSFDLVLAATALHWVRTEARFRKPHQLLRRSDLKPDTSRVLARTMPWAREPQHVAVPVTTRPSSLDRPCRLRNTRRTWLRSPTWTRRSTTRS